MDSSLGAGQHQRLREKSLAFIDLNEFTRYFRSDMFMDQIRLNAEGNRVVAGIVHEEIRTSDRLRTRM